MAAIQVPIIRIRGLRKSYGAIEAVRGIDLDVEEGEVFGLLGPNGAGKTTTVEILEGYRPRSAGEVTVLGHDPAKARPRPQGAHRHRPAGDGRRALPQRHRGRRPLPGLLPQVPPHRRAAGPHRARSPARPAGEDPVRGPEAAPRPGPRPRRRPRAAVPRRAHHRLRPVRPPGGLGRDQGPAGAGHDDPAHHPLHGRGPGAGRPGGGDRRRRHRGRGTARQPGRQRAGHRDPLHPPPGHRRRRPARAGPAGHGRVEGGAVLVTVPDPTQAAQHPHRLGPGPGPHPPRPHRHPAPAGGRLPRAHQGGGPVPAETSPTSDPA